MRPSTDGGPPRMDVLGIIRSQYQAALDMLAAAVEACPDAVWDRPEDRNRSWQVAYHALFYLHFYLQPTEADFRPWPKHREQAPHFDRPPWLPEGEFVASEAYTKAEIREYLTVCRDEVDRLTPTLDLEAPSGFDWLPMTKLELQLYSLRHTMQHVGELYERLAKAGAAELPWVGMGGAPAEPLPDETIVIAGGCFWGMEALLREIPGVLDTEVGYAGGDTPDPTYPEVRGGRTGHAESVRVTFDPSRLSLATLLEDWFYRMHDPTTVNRQGNDIGSQYRSAIFYADEEQRRVAEAVTARVEASGRWKRPIVTQILPAGPFTPAEDYHQDYLVKNPGGYTCHFMRD
ncbi:MAG: peptide-methionine (S)-S-oxide reductase MsrA [Chloroflexi bacterium]|nr:peptide-methionine (S)-S-oxide reductase MsrA [Chloroflexota bacterium]